MARQKTIEELNEDRRSLRRLFLILGIIVIVVVGLIVGVGYLLLSLSPG